MNAPNAPTHARKGRASVPALSNRRAVPMSCCCYGAARLVGWPQKGDATPALARCVQPAMRVEQQGWHPGLQRRNVEDQATQKRVGQLSGARRSVCIRAHAGVPRPFPGASSERL